MNQDTREIMKELLQFTGHKLVGFRVGKLDRTNQLHISMVFDGSDKVLVIPTGKEAIGKNINYNYGDTK